MCTCTCKECNEKQLIDYLNNQERNSRFDKIDTDIIRSNLPIIIDLVGKYNEISKEECRTATHAIEKDRLLESLAYKIVKYCR